MDKIQMPKHYPVARPLTQERIKRINSGNRVQRIVGGASLGGVTAVLAWAGLFAEGPISLIVLPVAIVGLAITASALVSIRRGKAEIVELLDGDSIGVDDNPPVA